MKSRFFILIIGLMAGLEIFAAKLSFAEIFSDGMVLQRNEKVSVWGTSQPGKKVFVSIQNRQAVAQCDGSGAWQLQLPELRAGGPYTLKAISEKDSVVLREVYVGEVWIAGGQSNMAFELEKNDASSTHIAKAKNRNIRFAMVPQVLYEGHKVQGDMKWRTATTENVARMSAVAYFFAKDLQEQLDVPVGIICCYKGGSGAETWMSRQALLQNPTLAPIVQEYEAMLDQRGKPAYEELYTAYRNEMKLYNDSVKAGYKNLSHPEEPMGERHYKRPYGLYNTMLKRIIPFTSKGVIWYQGESNATRAEQYQTLFPALIDEWRSDFKNPILPFLFVQLPNYEHPKYKERPMWAELREAQLQTFLKVKNTAMVVSLDAGERNALHPKYKEPVGKRLAACAFNRVYGMNVPFSGPIYKKATFSNGKACLSFNYVYDGLLADGDLKGFTICGKDHHFVNAHASIVNDQVVVWADEVTEPVAVRYNWSNWGDGNLKNSAQIPASPFRTDNFSLLSQGVLTAKY